MTGELATSKAGHDKDRLYLVVKEDKENVYLCDGRLRGVTNPKKKKKKQENKKKKQKKKRKKKKQKNKK